MVFKLKKKLTFPNPYDGEPDGLLAIGGDLSVDRLLLAYYNGIFPWYSFREGIIQWWCPLKRFVIFPNEIHISHSMRTLMNKGQYKVSINHSFYDVINTCNSLHVEEEGAWLGQDMVDAYCELYEQGFAISVEVWDEERLVGGLYGVALGRCFFGESMFSLIPSASKLALIYFAQFFEKKGGILIDCQFETPHLKSMGGRYINYEEYLEYVQKKSYEPITPET